MRLEFIGSQWALGAVCAAAYLGHISPWWLLLVPVLLFVHGPSFTFEWQRS